MTRFTVVWLRRALNQLAQIWMESASRDAVTAAANVVDTDLAEDPDLKGSENDQGMRQLVVRPLVVLFTVREADRIAEVTAVKLLSEEVSGNGAPLS